MVMTDLDAARIAPGPAKHEYQPQAVPDKGTQGIPVLDMEECTPLTKHPAFVILLDTKALPQMNLANAFPQQLQGGFIKWTGIHKPLCDAPAQISIPPVNRFVITGALCYGDGQGQLKPGIVL